MSEYFIESNIIIEDVETVCNTIQSLSKRTNFCIKDIGDFICEEPFTKFYLDEKMNLKKENDYGNKVLWLDTGFQAEDGKAIFISLLANGSEYSGHFVGTAATLSRKIREHYTQYKRAINKNLQVFYLKYQAMLSKRTTQHITDKFAYIKEDSTELMFKDAYACVGATLDNGGLEDSIGLDNLNESVVEGMMATALKNAGVSLNKSCPISVEMDDQDEHEEVIQKKIPSWILDLYDGLLMNTWKKPEGLDRYIKIIGARIQQIIDQKKTEYYIMNNLRSVVINTGLIDKFGTDVLILYKMNLSENNYRAYNVVMSKTELLTENFKIEDIKRELKPINFNDQSIILDASFNDFDINYKSLAHIIEERIERFPESYRTMKADVLAFKIKSALEIGLKLQHRDQNYAKPVYSTKQTGISWYLPLHIHNSLSEEPELVMVIKKAEAFYQVKTILVYDDNIKDRITAMTLYSNSW